MSPGNEVLHGPACRRLAGVGAFLLGLLFAGSALASPQGGTVVGGQGTISRPDARHTVIDQHSSSMAIDWRSFNLAPDDVVNFRQPSASAAALNRIYDQNPSTILGTINANGRVFLINPNGLIFGAGARVNVGSLMAGTLDISTDDFMRGDYRFAAPPGTVPGVVINRGLIQAATGGSVTLMGGAVANEGLILARYGHVNLGAGRAATLDFNGDGLLRFRIDQGVIDKAADLTAAVSNSGTIDADGGQVLLTGNQSRDVFSQVVNNSGVIRAGRIENEGGVIRLTATGGGVVNTGTLDASARTGSDQGGTIVVTANSIIQSGNLYADGTNGGSVNVIAADTVALDGGSVTSAKGSSGNGGEITIQSDGTTELTGNSRIDVSSASARGGTAEILGYHVGLFDFSLVNANGASGGGTILVGGDAHGVGTVQLADATYLGSDAFLSADATGRGDGGQVVVWGTHANNFFGAVSARGGPGGGDGGWVETSAHTGLTANGSVDASAMQGESGSWLLDPYNITIENAGDDLPADGVYKPSGDATVNVSSIASALKGGSEVRIFTNDESAGNSTGNITLESAITASGEGSLYLEAVGSIYVNAGISSDGNAPLNVYLWGNYGGDAEDTSYSANANCPSCEVIIGQNNVANITTTNGDVDVRTGADSGDNSGGSIKVNGEIDTGTGSLAMITGSGDIDAASGKLVIGGASTFDTGEGAITLNNDGNDFSGVVTLKGGNTEIRDSANLTLGTVNSGALTVIGDEITLTGPLTSTSNVNLSAATAGTINLHHGNISADGSVTFNSAVTLGTDVTISSNGITFAHAVNGPYALELDGLAGGVELTSAGADEALSKLTVTSSTASTGSLNIGSGGLSITVTAGDFTQDGEFTVAGASKFDAGEHDINLNDSNNDFQGSVSLIGNNITLVNDGALKLGASTIGGTFDVTAVGDITQNGALTVTGASDIDAGNGAITLTDGGNDFTGAVSLSNSGNHDVALSNGNNALILGDVHVGEGTLEASGAGITQTAGTSITQTAGAGPATFKAGAGVLALGNNGNDFTGTVKLSNSGDHHVTLDNGGNPLTLGVVNTGSGTLTLQNYGGSLTLSQDIKTAGGAIDFSGPVFVDGTSIAIDTTSGGAAGADITFGGDVNGASMDSDGLNLTAGDGAVAFNGALGNSARLQNLTTSSSTFTLASTLDIANNLSITTTGGGIAQSGVWKVGGTSNFDAGDHAINLNGFDNVFTGAVSLSNSGDNEVTLHNNGALQLGASTTGGKLSVTAAGDITQSGKLDIGGEAGFDAGSGTIELNQGENDFRAAVTLKGHGIAVQDANNLTVALLDNGTNGAVSLIAGGTLTLTDAAAAIDTGNSDLTLASNGGALTISNELTGAHVSLTGHSGVTLGSDVTADTLTLRSTDSAIEQTGGSALTVTGTSDIDAGSGAITLNGSGNDFQDSVALIGGKTQIVDSDDLALGALHTGDLIVTSDGPLNLGSGNVGSLTAKSNGGTITQSGALTVAGASDIDADGGTITLQQLDNEFGDAVTLSGGATKIIARNNLTLGMLDTGNLTVTSTGALVLGSGHVGGTLDATSNDGPISQSDALVVTGASAIDAGTGTIELDTPGNDFQAAVTLTGGKTQVVDSNGLILGALQTGDLIVTSGGSLDLGSGSVGSLTAMSDGGAITQSGALTVIGASDIDAGGGAITLQQSDNEFGDAVTLSGGTTKIIARNDLTLGVLDIGNLTVASTGALVLGSGTVDGTLSATSNDGSISQADALTVTGATALDAGTGTIQLDASGNHFGDVIDLVGSAATIAGTDTLKLGQVDTGDLTVKSSGKISQSDSKALKALTVSGISDINGSSIALTNPGNDFQGAVSLTTAGSATIVDANDLTLGVLDTGNLTVISHGNLDLGSVGTGSVGSLSATSNNHDVTQSGALLVTGVSDIDAGSGAITLGQSGNDFGGAVTLRGAAAEIADRNGLTLGAFDTGDLVVTSHGLLDLGSGTTGGDLTATSNGGAISQSGALTVGGTAVIDAGVGAITLNGSGNDFQGPVILTGGKTQITDDKDLTLGVLDTGDLTVTSHGALDLGSGHMGALVATSNGGAITQSGTLAVAGTSDIDAGGGTITLQQSDNDFGGAVALSGGTIRITDNNNLTLGRGEAGDLTVAADMTTLADDIDATGSVRFNSRVQLDGGDVHVQGKRLFFTGSIDATAGNQHLTLTSGEDGVTLNGPVGGTNPLGSLTLDGTGVKTLNSSIHVRGPVTIEGATQLNGGSVTTDGGQIAFNGPVSLSKDTAINSNGGALLLSNAPITGAGQALSLDAGGGDVTLASIGSASDPLGRLSVARAGSLRLSGNVYTQGAIDLNAGGDIQQSGNIDSGGQNVSVGTTHGRITMASQAVTRTHGGDIRYAADNGSVTLGTLDAAQGNATVSALGGSILSNGARPNVIAFNANLEALTEIGKFDTPIYFDVPDDGHITLALGAGIAYIDSRSAATVTSNSAVTNIAGQILQGAAKGEVASLASLGYVDWSAFSPDLRLFGVRSGGLLLPPDQREE